MIDAQFYEDQSIPDERKTQFPDDLVALACKLKKDVLQTIRHSDTKADAIRQVISYLDGHRLRLIEPLQISLLAGQSFLYHDYQGSAGGLSPTPIRRITGDIYHAALSRAIKEAEGLYTWDDETANNPAAGARPRVNLGMFATEPRFGILVLVEAHWGPSFAPFACQYAHLRELITPVRIQVIDPTGALLKKIAENPEELYRIGPEQLELLVEDRFRAMGLETMRTGHINARDGGIDILFWPKATSFPFLGAAQVKWHRAKEIKTVARDVREFGSVIQTNPLNTGILITNTSFTPDAEWVARMLRLPIRLRDSQDLRRWIKGRFVDKDEWREIPSEIVLCPGVKIEIPRN